MTSSARRDLFLVACLAAVGAVVGSLAPWESGFGKSEAGTEDGGLYTLWLGGASVLMLLAFSLGRRRDLAVIAMLFGAAIFGIGGYHLVDLLQQSGPLGTDPVDPGWGVWLTVIGGAGLAVSCFVLIRKASEESRTGASE